MRKIYRSKIGTLYIVVLCALLIPLFAALYHDDYISVAIISFIILFAIYLYFATYYVVDGGNLIVAIGIFGKRIIPVKDISGISATGSLLSAPAFSINGRLQVEAGKNSIVISPIRPEAFCADLQEINPEIVIPFFLSKKSCCD